MGLSTKYVGSNTFITSLVIFVVLPIYAADCIGVEVAPKIATNHYLQQRIGIRLLPIVPTPPLRSLVGTEKSHHWLLYLSEKGFSKSTNANYMFTVTSCDVNSTHTSRLRGLFFA